MRKQPTTKQLIGRIRGYDVYSVSAFEVRDLMMADEEFGLYAIHHEFPDLVPENEIWLGQEGQAEWPVFLEGALAWAVNNNYDDALRAESLARGGLLLGSADPRIRYLHSVPDPVETVTVWRVDGKVVRDNWKTDFVEGGHHYVYAWIPKGEIWIADCVDDEIPFLLTHEYTEMCLMRDRCVPYLHAHSLANRAEWRARQKRTKV